MTDEAQRTAAIIPVRNEERHLGDVVSALRMQGFAVLVVDDRSSDRSAMAAAAAGGRVIASRGVGYSAAVMSGLQAALELNFDQALTIDGDGAHLPSDAAALLRTSLSLECDMVVGDRFRAPRDMDAIPTSKVCSNYFAAQLVSAALRMDVTDAACGLRLFSRRAASALIDEGSSGYELPYESFFVLRARRWTFASATARVRYDAAEPMVTRYEEIDALTSVVLRRSSDPRISRFVMGVRRLIAAAQSFSVSIASRVLFLHPVAPSSWLFQFQHRDFVSACTDLELESPSS